MTNKSMVAALFAVFSAVSLQAEIVGKFCYKGTPEDLNGDTIVVSDTMVAMSENVRVESFMELGDTITDTPSIFFIIDNSGSMSWVDQNDRLGNRFTVTSAFIDTLKNNFPKVEVGVAVFGTWLHFDPNDSSFFVKPSGRTAILDSGAYIPLLQLDRVYSQYGNRTGYDILKGILDTTFRTGGYPAVQYVDLSYQPTNTVLRSFSTNINAGFFAAREAFRNSTNSKNKQFIIFLSDGEANMPPSGYGQDPQLFQQGDSVPTTFTVYFTNGGGGVPTSLATMTTNIRTNGYSSSNPRSTYWGFNNTTFDNLMNLLMDSVFTVIATNSLGRPTRITIGPQSVSNWIDSSFTFGDLFPLRSQVTPFTFVINYRLSKNGRAVRDTTHIVNFCVRTSPGVQMDTSLYEMKYWNRDMMFRYNGLPVALIDGTMPTVELRFGYSPGTAGYNYTNVMADLMNTNGTSLDREIFLLSREGTADSFSVTFPRAVSASPVSSNGILEHASPDDTILAVFRNSESPRLPLDTLLISCPTHIDPASLGALLDSAVTRDLDGDGLIDRIDFYFNKNAVLSTDDTNGININLTSSIASSIDSIVQLSGSSYAVYIAEYQTNPANPVPQTSWTPTIDISGLSGFENVTGFRTTDGCPPVVWRAVKHIISTDPRQDTVTVSLSEKITAPDGSPFSTVTLPGMTFIVWDSSGGTFTAIDTLLDGINSFTRIISDSVLVFVMSNGNDLNSDCWISLQGQNPTLVDRNGIAPTPDSRKVRIIVDGSAVKLVIPVNPAGPSVQYVQKPVIDFRYTPEALTWIRSGPGNGVVFALQGLTVPEVDGDKVKGTMAIYDMAGNTVNWTSTDNVFAGISAGSSFDRNGYILYWNGLNRKGMAAAPGVYRCVITITYSAASKHPDVKQVSKFGLRL